MRIVLRMPSNPDNHKHNLSSNSQVARTAGEGKEGEGHKGSGGVRHEVARGPVASFARFACQPIRPDRPSIPVPNSAPAAVGADAVGRR